MRFTIVVLIVCLTSASQLLAQCFTPLPSYRGHPRGIVLYQFSGISGQLKDCLEDGLESWLGPQPGTIPMDRTLLMS